MHDTHMWPAKLYMTIYMIANIIEIVRKQVFSFPYMILFNIFLTRRELWTISIKKNINKLQEGPQRHDHTLQHTRHGEHKTNYHQTNPLLH